MNASSETIVYYADDDQFDEISSSPNLTDDASEETLLLSPKKQSKYYVWFILVLVACVGACFGGYTSILATYCSDELGTSKNIAAYIVTSFISLTYFFSLISGVVSDSYFDRYFVLLLGVFVYIGGTACLFIPEAFKLVRGERSFTFLSFIGIYLCAIGNGCCVPVLSTLIGDQFSEDEAENRSRYFAWFYWMVQLGSIATSVSLPFLLKYTSPVLVFGILGCVLGFGLGIFMFGQSFYIKREPTEPYFYELCCIVWAGIKAKWTGKTEKGEAKMKTRTETKKKKEKENDKRGWLDIAIPLYGEERVEETKTILSLLVLYLPLPFFWAMFVQLSSLWVFVAGNMNTTFFGFHLPESEIVAVNPVLDLFLIPFFSRVVYPLCEKCGYPLQPLQKMSMGLFFTVLSLVASTLVRWTINTFGAVTVLFMLPQIAFMSCGEITLAVTAYEFSYTQAPDNMKGLLTACWSLTMSVGSMLSGVLAFVPISKKRWALDAAYAGVMGVVFVIFVVLAQMYTYKGTQDSNEEDFDVVEVKINSLEEEEIELEEEDEIGPKEE